MPFTKLTIDCMNMETRHGNGKIIKINKILNISENRENIMKIKLIQ